MKENNNEKVIKLNEEFEQVKSLLEEYLTTNVSQLYKFKVNDDLLKIANLFKISPKHLNRIKNHEYFDEFSKSDYKDLIEFDDKVCDSFQRDRLHEDMTKGLIAENNLFLNFNYTETIDVYIKAINERIGLNCYGSASQIQIHGRLKSVSNIVNFGFGDEMDDDYKSIEKRNDNEYLKNIKSFKYLQNSNYKEMLDFIESDKFQVYIMGHSCGLSDRILLNKIFEHDKCRSIKVFYHQFDSPKANGATDNYTEIVQNISRHFNKKELMREKIVNKSLCQPLPQTVRFAKNNGPQ